MKFRMILFAVVVFTVCTNAQKPDVEKIKTSYRQFPSQPLPDSIKTYSIQVINLSKTELTLRDDVINKYLQLEGFEYNIQKPQLKITVVINDVPVELGTYSKARGANGVPIQFVYTATAKLVGSISFATPDNQFEYFPVKQLDKPEDLSAVVESSLPYPTEDDAKKAQANDKTLNDKVLKLFFDTAFKNIGAYLNKHHGYPVKTEFLPVWGIKSKGTEYQDFDQALASYQAGLALLNQPDKAEEMKAKFKEAIVVWEKAVGEYNPTAKDGRISSKNILEIYTNLTLANTWIANFAEAKKYYALAEKEKGLVMWKPVVQELLLAQEQGAEQDQLRKAGKTSFEKKLYPLYRSPELIAGATNAKYRIKYIETFEGKVPKSRKVFEYDDNGLLVRVYEQAYNFGKSEYFGTGGLQNLVYNHHEHSITVPPAVKKIPSEVYIMKQGRVIHKKAIFENLNVVTRRYHDYTYYPDGSLEKVVTTEEKKESSRTTVMFKKENGKLKSIIRNSWFLNVNDSIFGNLKYEFTPVNPTTTLVASSSSAQSKNNFANKAAEYTYTLDSKGLITKIVSTGQRFEYTYDANGNLTEAIRARDTGPIRNVFTWEEAAGNAEFYLFNPDLFTNWPGLYPDALIR